MDEFEQGAHPLDRRGGKALWSQLESELRRRLDAGDFSARFPTDRELMEIYGVSRHTVRHAVSELGAQGVIRRARGVGSSIDTSIVERSLGSLYSLFQVVEESGAEQRSEVRRLERVTDHVAAGHLGLPIDAELVVIERLRFAGTTPLAIDRIWLPGTVGRSLLEVDFTHTSLYDEMERTFGVRPNSGWERIRAALPSGAERDLLGLPDGVGMFAIERLGSHDGMPLEWRITHLRSDHVSFLADWSVGQRSEIRLQLESDLD